jgi:SAM-dependent methyltransferase
MDRRIEQSQAYWDRHAQQDPMWAVLSDPAKKGRRWDLREFMANGEREIALLMHQLAQLGMAPAPTSVLDFGCGIGRLTQALARRFDRVTGVDISPEMIALAREFNQYAAAVEYVCTGESDLRTLSDASYDLIYSNIVLQHVAPHASVEYLHAFFRLLKPSGILVFQLPSHQEPQGDWAILPMADPAYQARLELIVPVATQPAGSELLIPIRVTNVSPHEWRQRDCGSLRAGNHWFDETGRYMVVQDNGRAVLPQSLSPGESCNVMLPVRVPSAPGAYLGEIDLVHEGVTWFRDKGSAAVRFPVVVVAALGELQQPANTINELPVPDYPTGPAHTIGEATGDEIGPFPMYGVPREQVLDIVSKHGATLVHIEDGLRAGVEWVDYRYFIRAGG